MWTIGGPKEVPIGTSRFAYPPKINESHPLDIPIPPKLAMCKLLNLLNHDFWCFFHVRMMGLDPNLAILEPPKPDTKSAAQLLGKWWDPCIRHMGSLVYDKCLRHFLLVGGWATPLKNMNVHGDDEIPNIWENKKWQPNHQPVKFCVLIKKKTQSTF